MFSTDIQVEIHPLCYQRDLITFCHANGIAVQAYSPLGSPKGIHQLLETDAIVAAARKHQVSGAQVLLAWGMRVTDSVVVKSTKPEHLAEAFSSVTVGLDDDDVKSISSLSDSGLTHFCWDPSAVV